MKYTIVGIITLVGTLLMSKLFIALNIVNFDETPIAHENTLSDTELAKIGKPIYQVYCSSCHGVDGKGNNGKAQDHTKRIAEKSVVHAIENGSNNFQSIYLSGMPTGLVNIKDAKEVAKYVAGGMKGIQPKAWAVCATCHDTNGEGIPFIAPNIKTYSDELVMTVLTNGKKGAIGRMPSFKGRFSDYQMKALAAHIRSLGHIGEAR